jgi:hypothetical protein
MSPVPSVAGVHLAGKFSSAAAAARTGLPNSRQDADLWLFARYVRSMNLGLSRAGAVIAVCAAAVLALSACSDDSSNSADSSSSSAAPSSSSGPTPAEIDARAEDLMLAESDFIGGGTYTILDKAAIEADDTSDPEVTPQNCASIANQDDGTEQFDRAKVEYELPDGSSIETEVLLGQNGDFAQIESDIAACPAMTMREDTDGGEIVIDVENSLEDVAGATEPAKMIVSTGTVQAGTETTPVAIRSVGSYVDGATVSVQVTLIGDSAATWNSDDDAIVLDLLNKQIAIVQDAAAA